MSPAAGAGAATSERAARSRTALPPVTGQLRYPIWDKLGWYRENLRPYMVAWVFLFIIRHTYCRKEGTVVIRKRIALLAALALALLLMAGCRGEALPAGMEEDALLRAGREVALEIIGGDYEAAWEALRQDVRESVTAQDIQSLALQQLDGAGVYREIEQSMTTGQTVQGEHIGIAVLYCAFSEDDVLFRVSFDREMQLVGISIQKQ